MGQFVSQQMPSRHRFGRVLPPVENHIPAHRVGHCVDRPRRRIRLIARVDAHPAEIETETRLEKVARRCCQRSPAARRHNPRLARRRRASRRAHHTRLFVFSLPRFFFLAPRAFALHLLWRSVDGIRRGRGHPHHLVSHAVGFDFRRVTGLADGQSGLRRTTRATAAARATLLLPLHEWLMRA